MKVTFQEEDVSDIWDELKGLTEAHWKESAYFKDIPFHPDTETYHAMELADRLRCYTARLDGNLIGYLAFIVQPGLNCRQSLQAILIGIHLEKKYRGRWIGVRLIHEAEIRLAFQNVQVVYSSAPADSDTGKLLGILGYTLVEEVRAKRLDL